MAHKVMIGGTVYEVKGGKCLVNGTGYTIQKGRTLVNGTGYDVSFAGGPIAVTITGNGAQGQVYATIAGTQYYNATSGLEVMDGDVIVLAAAGGFGGNNTIVINGNTVASSSSVSKATYNWTVPSGISAITIVLSGRTVNGSVTVTTS